LRWEDLDRLSREELLQRFVEESAWWERRGAEGLTESEGRALAELQAIMLAVADADAFTELTQRAIESGGHDDGGFWDEVPRRPEVLGDA